MLIQVLHVDNDADHHAYTAAQLARLSSDITLELINSFGALLDRLEQGKWDCILSDDVFFEQEGQKIFAELRDRDSIIPLVLLSDLFGAQDGEFLEHPYFDDDYNVKVLVGRYDLLNYWIHKLVDDHKKLLKSQERDQSIEELKKRITEREYEILTLIADGLSNKEIAFELNISYRTVVNHIYNLFQKLGVNSRMEAVRLLQGGK